MAEAAPLRPLARAYLALGSNLGDRAGYLAAGLAGLGFDPEVEVVRVSRLFETPPWGPVPQGPYLNACAEIATTRAPGELLDLCLAVERAAGRERTVRWGPRTLDIDILTYDDLSVDDLDLRIPHPRMLERAFVLVPLLDIAPSLQVAGVPIAAAVTALDTSDITVWRE